MHGWFSRRAVVPINKIEVGVSLAEVNMIPVPMLHRVGFRE